MGNVFSSNQPSFSNAICHNSLLDVDNTCTLFFTYPYNLCFIVKRFPFSSLSLDLRSVSRADVLEAEGKWQS